MAASPMKPEDTDDARPRSNGFFRFMGNWLKMIAIYYIATLTTDPTQWASLIGNAFWIGLVFALPAKLIGDTMRQFGNTILFNADTAFMILYVLFFVITGIFNHTNMFDVFIHAGVYLCIEMIVFPMLRRKKNAS